MAKASGGTRRGSSSNPNGYGNKVYGMSQRKYSKLESSVDAVLSKPGAMQVERDLFYEATGRKMINLRNTPQGGITEIYDDTDITRAIVESLPREYQPKIIGIERDTTQYYFKPIFDAKTQEKWDKEFQKFRSGLSRIDVQSAIDNDRRYFNYRGD